LCVRSCRALSWRGHAGVRREYRQHGQAARVTWPYAVGGVGRGGRGRRHRPAWPSRPAWPCPVCRRGRGMPGRAPVPTPPSPGLPSRPRWTAGRPGRPRRRIGDDRVRSRALPVVRVAGFGEHRAEQGRVVEREPHVGDGHGSRGRRASRAPGALRPGLRRARVAPAATAETSALRSAMWRWGAVSETPARRALGSRSKG
jgi:hypothetical protein